MGMLVVLPVVTVLMLGIGLADAIASEDLIGVVCYIILIGACVVILAR